MSQFASASRRTTRYPDAHAISIPQGHPEHPYRTNPLIKLQSIPTVIRYFNGVEKGRVVERDCKNEDMLYDLADL